MFSEQLRESVGNLPGDLRLWMGKALESQQFQIGAQAYDDGPGGTLCPIAAAATLAGAWTGDGISPGRPHWGTVNGPSEPVEDFAAWFDLCSESEGLESAIELIKVELHGGPDIRGYEVLPTQISGFRQETAEYEGERFAA